MLTQNELEKMKEDSLRTEVLIPLFRAMDFRDVYDYHGRQELGKDIVMWRKGRVGNRENYAVVAKAHRVTGDASRSVAEVGTQIRQCFGSSYADPVDGSRQEIHQCYLVPSHEMAKEAVDALRAVLQVFSYQCVII